VIYNQIVQLVFSHLHLILHTYVEKFDKMTKKFLGEKLNKVKQIEF